MIRSIYFSPKKEFQFDLSQEEIAARVAEETGLLWVDFENTLPESDEPFLQQAFNFHPLAIDDALQETHAPKLDDWETYLYIVLQAVRVNPSGLEEVQLLELDVFLGKHYMVTHHDQPILAIDKVWESVQQDQRYIKNGADRLLYRLIDEVVGSYMPVFEHLDSDIDITEDKIFNNPTPETLEQIFAHKRTILRLRRVIGPQREVLNRLARDEFAVIDRQSRVYFRDVYDHLVRMHDITETMRDLISGVLDMYLSVINNRMNEIMKTLTIITTLFMPLAFIGGFFGMNFFSPSTPLDIWTGPAAFYVTLAITILTPLIMFTWIRRRGWMKY